MRFRQAVALGASVFGLVEGARSLWVYVLFADPRGSYGGAMVGLNAAFLVAGTLAFLLFAWGYWNLPTLKGRAMLAASFGLGFIASLVGTTLNAFYLGPAGSFGFMLFAFTWVLALFSGLTLIFSLAWWSGHERSRYLLAASMAPSVVMILLGMGKQPLSSITIFALAALVLSVLEIVGLHPRFDPPVAQPLPLPPPSPDDQDATPR